MKMCWRERIASLAILAAEEAALSCPSPEPALHARSAWPRGLLRPADGPATDSLRVRTTLSASLTSLPSSVPCCGTAIQAVIGRKSLLSGTTSPHRPATPCWAQSGRGCLGGHEEGLGNLAARDADRLVARVKNRPRRIQYPPAAANGGLLCPAFSDTESATMLSEHGVPPESVL